MEDENSRLSLSSSRSAEKPVKTYTIWGAIAGVILIGFGAGAVYPAISSATGTLSKIEATKVQNIESVSIIDGLRAKEAGLEVAKANVDKFISKFPPGADQKQLVDDLSVYAADTGTVVLSINATAPTVIGPNGGVEVETVQPAAIDPANPNEVKNLAPAPPGAEFPLAQVNLDIVVTGSFDQATEFLKKMESGRRSFVIDSVSLSPDAEGSGAVSIKARSFIARELVAPPKPGDAAKTPAEAPAATP